eukprot:Gb_28957 [translate_table: standard]
MCPQSIDLNMLVSSSLVIALFHLASSNSNSLTEYSLYYQNISYPDILEALPGLLSPLTELSCLASTNPTGDLELSSRRIAEGIARSTIQMSQQGEKDWTVTTGEAITSAMVYASRHSKREMPSALFLATRGGPMEMALRVNLYGARGLVGSYGEAL